MRVSRLTYLAYMQHMIRTREDNAAFKHENQEFGKRESVVYSRQGSLHSIIIFSPPHHRVSPPPPPRASANTVFPRPDHHQSIRFDHPSVITVERLTVVLITSRRDFCFLRLFGTDFGPHRRHPARELPGGVRAAPECRDRLPNGKRQLRKKMDRSEPCVRALKELL